jgi:hypothetical protein
MSSVRIAFLFEAEYLLRRGRKPKVELFEGESVLPVRTVGREGMEPAFEFRDFRFGQVEILQRDDKLWWPMYFEGSRQPATLAELEAKLADREFDLLGLGPSAPRCRRASTRLDHWRIRQVLRDTTDTVLSRALGKLELNVLICDGIAYARGGAPLYLPPGGALPTPWFWPGPSFVNSGADRSIDRDECLRWQPGDFSEKVVQVRLRKRAFLSARAAVDSYVGSADPPLSIGILTTARDNLDCCELHIDACLREIRNLLDSPAWAVAAMSLSSSGRNAERRSLGRLGDELRSATKSNHSSNRFATTLTRADAIESFVRFVDGHDWNFGRGDLVEECRQAIAALDRAECETRAQASAFSAEDDQALGWLSEPDRRPGPPN